MNRFTMYSIVTPVNAHGCSDFCLPGPLYSLLTLPLGMLCVYVCVREKEIAIERKDVISKQHEPHSQCFKYL